MRFQYKCHMATCDPSFLLNKSSRKPFENYATDYHGVNTTDLPFSYPGALEEFYQGHVKHQGDKQNEASMATDLYDFVYTTVGGQTQGLSFGSLGLATHISHIKSGYYASDTIMGLSAIVEFLSETTAQGCNFYRLLCAARDAYENDQSEFNSTPDGLKRDVSGRQYWRAIHTHSMLVANKSYTMHACNLNVFEEMLTRSLHPPTTRSHTKFAVVPELRFPDPKTLPRRFPDRWK
jgi:hypothetical protein